MVNKERYVVPCSDAAGYASTIQNEKGKQAQFINKPKIIRLVLCSANPAVNITPTKKCTQAYLIAGQLSLQPAAIVKNALTVINSQNIITNIICSDKTA